MKDENDQKGGQIGKDQQKITLEGMLEIMVKIMENFFLDKDGKEQNFAALILDGKIFGHKKHEQKLAFDPLKMYEKRRKLGGYGHRVKRADELALATLLGKNTFKKLYLFLQKFI